MEGRNNLQPCCSCMYSVSSFYTDIFFFQPISPLKLSSTTEVKESKSKVKVFRLIKALWFVSLKNTGKVVWPLVLLSTVLSFRFQTPTVVLSGKKLTPKRSSSPVGTPASKKSRILEKATPKAVSPKLTVIKPVSLNVRRSSSSRLLVFVLLLTFNCLHCSNFLFRPSATVSRIGLMESCTCCRWYGRGTPPPLIPWLAGLPPGLPPPRKSCM